MNSGVYCRPKTPNTVYNAILIDQYNRCIFGDSRQEAATMQVDDLNLDSLGPSSAGTNSSEEEKWECGMNVKARFSEDGEYYEAIIEKMFDEYAVVRYLGYDNEEAVKVKELRPSRGEEFINEQLEQAKEEKNRADDDDDDAEDEYEEEYDDDSEEIDWKAGMNCRALYEPNEVVYEAVVQEVSVQTRTAIVIMIGYGLPYEASFDNMYESIPELRIKQETTAKAHLAAKEGKSTAMPNTVNFKLGPYTSAHEESKEYHVIPPRNNVIPPPHDTDLPPPHIPKLQPGPGDLNFGGEQSMNTAANSAASCVFSQCQGILQPQTENDALACMISSNYLSGYYAGYYDCLKNANRQKNQMQ